MSRAAAEAATWYQRTFHGRADQVSQVRREIARHLGDCPAADDAVLIASELAANSVVLQSASGGEFFTMTAIDTELARRAGRDAPAALTRRPPFLPQSLAGLRLEWDEQPPAGGACASDVQRDYGE